MVGDNKGWQLHKGFCALQTFLSPFYCLHALAQTLQLTRGENLKSKTALHKYLSLQQYSHQSVYNVSIGSIENTMKVKAQSQTNGRFIYCIGFDILTLYKSLAALYILHFPVK